MIAIAHAITEVLATSALSKPKESTLPSGCPSYGWSVVTSAPTISSFAGILAGFVFTAVTILITRSGVRNTQALGLLSCAFVVLGFDSYLFSSLSGSISDTNCARVWDEGVSASGMLGVGGLAVVTGVSWLLADRAVDSDDQAAKDVGITWPPIRLDRVSRAMAHCTGFLVALLLGSTILDYAKYGFGGDATQPLGLTALACTGVVLVSSLALTLFRHYRPASPISAQIAKISFWLASYGLLFYTVADTIFVGYVTNISQRFPIDLTAVLMGLPAPSLLLIALVQSVAPSAYPVVPKSKLPAAASAAEHGY
jgi:hypothetical protein